MLGRCSSFALVGVGDLAWGSTCQGGEAVRFESLSGTTRDELTAAEPGLANLIDH
jgi:hypothetical protein